MDKNDLIEGRNPVIEALKSEERSVEKLFVSKGEQKGSVNKILGMAKDKRIQIEYVERVKLDEMTESKSHQGVVALVSPYKYKELEDIFDTAKERGEDPFILILDGIEDVHNFGAIVRTAECAGVHGVIIPKRRSASVNSTVLKTSAGAAEYMNIVKVTNLAATIDELKSKGVWIYGADMDGDYYYDMNLKGPIALVVGSEGKGMSRLTKEKCDALVKIPMSGKISSLNASVASSIVIYEVVKQRRG